MRTILPLLFVLISLCPGAVWANRSNSLLDVSRDGKRLLAVNNDNNTVTVIDTIANKALREIKVGKKPECVSWIGAGPLAAVTCYHADKVVIFNSKTGKIVHELAVDDEPYGIVVNKAGTHAWVTHEYPGLVSEIDLNSVKVTRKMKAGAWLRGIALSQDEKKLYVCQFYQTQLHAIDLKSGKVVDSWDNHSKDNLGRHVLLHPKRPKAYVSHIRSMTHVIHGDGSIFPFVSCFDLRPKKKERKRRNPIGMDSYNGVYVVANSWEADISPDGKLIYTIYAGTNDMNISRVIDDDYREMVPIGRARRLGKNPRAVRVSPDGKKVYVYNAMDFAVSVYDAQMRYQSTIKTCAPPKSPEWVLGKILFNTANYPMSRRRWISCSSCHPDGNHDGRTWNNPEGLRRTTAFFGMAHTLPLHWSGDRDETQDFEYTIRGRLMFGGGLFNKRILRKRGFEKTELKQKLSGVSKDLDALAIYCNSFDFTLSPHIPAAGKLYPAAQRGKKIFLSKKTGCAKCHSGPYFSDSRLKTPYNLHDVGTGRDDKSEKMGTKYDTPTLLGVYRHTMYLHDGKAKTLRDVLTTFNKNDSHGATSHLRRKEIDDLVAFLKSLPYEHPPSVTPNTVSYRFVPKKK